MKKIMLISGMLLSLGSCILYGQKNDSIPQDLQLTSKDSIVVSSWMAGLGWNVINDSGSRLNNLTDFGDRYNYVIFPSRVSIGRYFKSGIGLEAIGTYNQYEEGNIIDGSVNPEDQDYFALDARLSYDLNKLFGQTGFFDPYLGVGLGYSDANDVGFGTYNAIVGFRTWFNDKWGLDFNSSGKWAFGNSGSNHVQYGAGVVYQWKIEKELSKKGLEKLTMIQAMEQEQQRIQDSILAARKAEEEARALADRLEKEKEAARLAAAEEAKRMELLRLEQALDSIGGVYFAFDSSNLTSTAKNTLGAVADLMAANPGYRFIVEAHADSRGPKEYNQRLSERRAQSTIDYLNGLGVGMERLEAIGHGEEKLVNHCADGVRCSAAEHRKNRRSVIEIHVIKKEAEISK